MTATPLDHLVKTFRLLTLLAAALLVTQCGPKTTGKGPTLAELQESAAESRDPDLVGRWLLAELLAPGGDAKRVKKARKQLDQLEQKSLFAELARGLDDELHGRLRTAPVRYLGAVEAAVGSSDELAPYVAWFSAQRAVELRHDSKGLWKRFEPLVKNTIREPGRVGWRARAELVDWAMDEAYAEAEENLEERTRELFGCVKALSLAGPFGRNVPPDAFRSFAAEAPGPWPAAWKPLEGIGRAPRVLKTKRHGCQISSDGWAGAGIFYAQAFLELSSEAELLMAAQGALAIWVNDREVLTRDPREWGAWPRFGVQLRLPAGRHRILIRLSEPSTSLRILHPDGRPYPAKTDTAQGAPYSLVAPERTLEPNLVSRYVRDGKALETHDFLKTFLIAELALIDGQADVASVVFEPLLKDMERAAGPALSAAAAYVRGDPIFDGNQTRELMRTLYERAERRDPELWEARLSLSHWEAENSGPSAAVRPLRELVRDFPDVPAVSLSLAQLYGGLGWSAEYTELVKKLVDRFPDNPGVLHAGVDVFSNHGQLERADTLVKHIRELDPDSEILLTRSLERQDYDTAIKELRRLEKRRPDRKDIVERVFDVMVRAGNTSESWRKLEAAIEDEPKDASARLALADARFASGDRHALRKALIDAMQAGASTDALDNALDLVEGMNALEPYRMDAKRVIAEFEAADRPLAGTAARVLDYSVVWVRSDGSSEMLEHQVVRIQSTEGITRFAEMPELEGQVLGLRVIKADGSILEPEFVEGKPTVTMPHLEVGDYVETERVISMHGDGERGLQYLSPRWFFREENIGYARSEFVVISPKEKPLVIETHNGVPKPTIEERGPVVIRRFRVDYSPPAPSEPHSAPVTEFLPNVWLGWGVTQELRLQALADRATNVTPTDPRIRRIAQKIVEPVPRRAELRRARQLYHWVLANVEPGQESDGRRAIISKSGNRHSAFLTLCHALGIRAHHAVAKNALALDDAGPISETSAYSSSLIRVGEGKKVAWLVLANRFAPFGYVPAQFRGMPAYTLDEHGAHATRVATGDISDNVEYRGSGKLAADGSAELEVEERYFGEYAILLRQGFSQLPEARLRSVIESRLVAPSFRGAELVDYSIEGRDEVDQPLIVRLKLRSRDFAQETPQGLVITPPLAPRISALASLPARETPLLIGEATLRNVMLSIELPKGARLSRKLAQGTHADGNRRVTIRDRLEDQRIVLDRTISLPTGRIQPDEYPAFVRFARSADDALSAAIRVQVP